MQPSNAISSDLTLTRHPGSVLLDTIPKSLTRDMTAVIGFALLTALAAQITIPLGFTPVPITGQTFAVLLAGGALGANRGALSQLLYVVLGAIGLPFYAEGGKYIVSEGALIATFGYLFGFVAAAYVVGAMAERKQDRHILSAIPAFVAGSIVIYIFGASFLAYSLDIPLLPPTVEGSWDFSAPNAFTFGVAPYLVGDLLKAVIAGLLLPAAWIAFDER